MKKPQKYTDEQKRAIINEIDKLVSDGMFKQDAAKQFGIHKVKYYDWKKQLNMGSKKRGRPKKKYSAPVQLVELPISPQTQTPLKRANIALIIGNSDEVVAALKRCSSLFGLSS